MNTRVQYNGEAARVLDVRSKCVQVVSCAVGNRNIMGYRPSCSASLPDRVDKEDLNQRASPVTAPAPVP
jgi:hypothetical protein